MPLHDWLDRPGWEGVHFLWVAELLRWVQPRLPDPYRVRIGTAPALAMGFSQEAPDTTPPAPVAEELGDATVEFTPAGSGLPEPDEELEVGVLQPDIAVMVERDGRLVAAIEVASPRNKERPLARTTTLARYLSYLFRGVHLLLIDVHRRPLAFSFADRIAAELQAPQPSCPSPLAVSYRVGEVALNRGRFLAVWRRTLSTGDALPTLPLPLSVEQAVAVDLEATYRQAAAAAYLT